MALSFCRLQHLCRVAKKLQKQHQGNSLCISKCLGGFTTSCNSLVDKTFSRLADVNDEKDIDDELQSLQKIIADTEADGKENRRVVKRKGQYDGTQLHIPVMASEVLQYLGGKENQTILDMTFGAGGHSRALLDSSPGCHILALDRDPTAYQLACELAQQRPGQVTPMLGRFSELSTLLTQHGIETNSLDGALMDLGSSSMQFDQSERGFSISADGPLDMRMDGTRCPDLPTAADVVNTLDEVDLSKIIKKYGEDGQARKIAHGIVEARSRIGRIRSTKQLADIILEIFEGGFGTDKLGRYSHPATKTFQALRIFVNNEMNELNFGLTQVYSYLKNGGTCVAISFHSLEDRIVKRHFKDIDIDLAKGMSLSQRRKLGISQKMYTRDQLEQMTSKRWTLLNKKVLEPTEEEVERNPRSRSAKLRAATKAHE